MIKYQCDVQMSHGGPKFRCPHPAVVAFDYEGKDGREMLQFCSLHVPKDWTIFERFYSIEHDELLEMGISKFRRATDRTECPAIASESSQSDSTLPGEAVPREFAREALKRHREKTADVLFMKELKIKWP